MGKPKPKSEPKPDLHVVYDDAPPRLFVIRHQPSGTWWGPDEAGYFGSLLRAGTYSEEKAREIEQRRGEDEAVPLDVAMRDFVSGATPTVLQAMFALGGR